MAEEQKVMIGLEIHASLDTKSKLFCPCATSAFGIPWVKEYLKKKGASFEFVEHEAVTRPVDSARVRGVKIEQIAKALVYVADSKPVLLILSGNRKADEQKVMQVLNVSSVRMASPEEVKEYTKCVVGLVPPVIDGVRKIIDARLMEQDLWSFNAGTATAGIKIKREEVLKVLDNAQTAEISEDGLIAERGDPQKAVLHEIEATPNSLCCPTCLGHPGAKPVLNRKAVEHGVKVGLALNCEISRDFFFSRKTYFYPDMATNYQITQYEVPLAKNGFVLLPSGKQVKIKRAHLEWDPASLVHPSGMGASNYVLIDYNRSDSPLIEIVTEPDISSPAEAREFLNALENLLNYLRVLKPDTALKADCNISIAPNDRVEIKNVSGFAAAEKALSYELARQRQDLANGKKAEQHTRAFNAESGATVALRKKETEDDYGYIFDPDLVKVSLSEKEIFAIKAKMPELPEIRAQRYQKQFGLSAYESRVLCSELELAKLFEDIVYSGGNPVAASKLLARELLSILNHDSLSFGEVSVSAAAVLELVRLIDAGKVSDKNAKQAMINYISGDKTAPKAFLEKGGMLISEAVDIDAVIARVLAANEKAVADYKGGNQKTFNFLAGLIMRETKGTVSPQKVQEALKQRLG